jgi:hypothetical protein
MGARRRFTRAQVVEALRNAAGIYSGAAQMLGCAPNTIANYVDRSPKLQKLVREIQEQHLDLAETKLLTHLRDGNLKAVIFYLKTKGKVRGYSERTEVTGPNGRPLSLELDVTKLSDEELEQIIAGKHVTPRSGNDKG